MLESPLVSVILPIHNAEQFLFSAIESILLQTYRVLEVLIVNDRSQDASLAIARSFLDPRIRIVDNDGNGLVDALNTGIRCSRGALLARMDGDDICYPDRLALQVTYLAGHAGVGCICSDALRIDEQGRSLGEERFILHSSAHMVDGLLYKRPYKPIIHPTALFRREHITRIGGYRHYTAAEDRDLWLRLAEVTEIRRLNTPLLQYRVHSGGVSRRRRILQKVSGFEAVLHHVIREKGHVDLYSNSQPVRYELQRLLKREFQEADVSQSFANLKKAFRQRDLATFWSSGLELVRSRRFDVLPGVNRRISRFRLQRYTQLGLRLIDAASGGEADC